MNETMQVILGGGSALAIVLYWAVCRRISLRYRKKAADLIEDYFARDDVSEESVSAISITYKSATFWAFLPLISLFSPLILLMALVTGKGTGEKPGEEHAAILDAIMKMYISRNPLTAMMCFYFIFIAGIPVMVVALMLERMKTIPNPLRIYGLAAARIAAKHHFAHNH
ncbi:hypothetical protein [Stutzerimonas frequens]|uniref:hypothetical protein n=1 Tax=Stutzerimonas frequens TaxID=2968969 RepID=UPI00190DF10D|nr:hypothetical protein [Stutzerimonas frequens]MBK3874719.1 hypothetical protein [Stutzerimonas frequens]MBK3912982.1 hypothetical protein [Stutzerimonas frequens]MBK3929960.1 hypothetical protein [Stutzerimonas frequens]